MLERLTVVVGGSIGWPSERRVVNFDGIEICLLPQTHEQEASAHIDLTKHRMAVDDAYTTVNRFLSAVAWKEDAGAANHGGWAGNQSEHPVPAARRALACNWANLFPNRSQSTSVQRRALSLYREALNAEEACLPTFAVLGYYRILEMKGSGSQEDARKWIAAEEGRIRSLRWLKETLTRVDDARRSLGFSQYLMARCRVAVAHATSSNSGIDPDDILEIRRMSDAVEVLRCLARRFIEVELGVE